MSTNVTGTTFKPLAANTTAPRRLIISVEGEERQGKTHFGLTAPGPLAYMQMDPGGQELLPKIKKLFPRKEILAASYSIDVLPTDSPEKIAEKCERVWARTVLDYETMIPRARSLVVDTCSEWFLALRLARFGKLTQVMPESYGPVYAEFRRLIRLAYDHQCNVIYLHKLKPEYEKTESKTVTGKRAPAKKTGELELEGFKNIKYEVQMQVRCFREDGEFKALIRDCRQNPDVEGMVLEQNGLGCDFSTLAQVVYPDSKPGDWE